MFGGGGQLAERQAYRAPEVFVLKLLGRQHLHDGCAAGLKLLKLMAVDVSRHLADLARIAHASWQTSCTLPGVMVSMSGGGGGAALGSPATILVLLVIIALVGGVYLFVNR